MMLDVWQLQHYGSDDKSWYKNQNELLFLKVYDILDFN